MEDEVEGVVTEGKALGFSLIERGFAMFAAKVTAAGAKHSHGKIEAMDLSVRREEAEVGSSADGDFQDAHVGAEFEFGGEEGAEIVLDDALVGGLGEIIEWGDAVIHALILEIETLRGWGENRDSFLEEVTRSAGMERLGAKFERGASDWVAEDI
jgi:hypothetical protein